MRRLALAGFILFGSVFTPLVAYAQECEIDLTDSIIALTQAQADAASGNTSGALAAISNVQTTLDHIQQACAGQSSAAALTETFTAPDDLFSFNYPANWFVTEFQQGQDWATLLTPANSSELAIPDSGIVTVTSQEVALDYSPFVALEGVESVTVVVGNPLHLFTELGLYSEEFSAAFLEGSLDYDALLDALEAGIRQSPLAPELTVTTVDAARSTASLEVQSDDGNLTLVLVALDEDENLYALLVSPIAADQDVDILPLLQSMAETIE
jgi:hypothetical protein